MESEAATYRAGAGSSLVGGPYSRECKCAKMNQTLTAACSSWTMPAQASPVRLVLKSHQTQEQRWAQKRRCGPREQSSPSCAPTPPHAVPDENVVSRPLSRTLFPENRHQFRLLCFDVKYSHQKASRLVNQEKVRVERRVAWEYKVYSEFKGAAAVCYYPGEWPLSVLWRGLPKPIFWRVTKRFGIPPLQQQIRPPKF